MIEMAYIVVWFIIAGGVLGRIFMKRPPKVLKGILGFVGLFGVATGILLMLNQNIILTASFHIWSVGIIFILIMLILAGI